MRFSPFSSSRSIKQKLTLLMMAVSGVALLVASAAFVVNHNAALRSSKATQLVALADVLAYNSTTAMSFDQAEAARELLASLANRPTVQYACLFDTDGAIFAAYRRDADSPEPTSLPDWVGHHFDDEGHLTVCLPVTEQNEVLGSIYIHATTEDLRDQFYRDAGITVVATVMALAVAVLISFRLQRIISVPILDLAATAQRITERADYSIRIEPRSTDEIGSLYEQFNLMLDRIQGSENALRAERDHSASIINGSPSIVYGTLPDGTTSFVNPAGEKITGYSEKELMGQDSQWSLLYPGKEHEQVERFLEKLQEGEVRDYEMTLTTKAGKKRIIAWNSVKRYDSQGNFIELIGFGNDVTERRQAEEALRRSEERFRTLVENVPGMIYRSELKYPWKLEHVSDQVAALTGYPAGDFVEEGARDFGELIIPEDVELVSQAIEQGIALREPYVIEYRIRHADGEIRWVYERGQALYDEQGTPLCLDGVILDVTDRKRAADEREKLIVELEAKNAELEQFAYTVSHDLKTPLITIKGYVGLLKQDLAEDNAEATDDDMTRIAQAADKMNDLLGQILELSRIGRVARPPEEVKFDDLAGETLELLAGVISSKQIDIRIAPDLPVLYGDRGRLFQVLQNLLENAVKYMGDQAEPRIEIGAREEGGQVVCYVRDNGLGIDPRYHQKIFGLFDQLDQGVEGTGVGLALVKRIIEVHGGRIWVESEGPGRGSTFCFMLPSHEGQAASATHPATA